jgi:molybdopterin-guanine dinucleotide biosynthesis protein A
MILARSQVALGILAGGQARRMGGIDKALVRHRGERLLDRVLEAAGAGYAQVLVSYNGGGLAGDRRVVADLHAGHPGPLAGVEALLSACASDWLLTLPVDLEDVPSDLCERLVACAMPGTGVRARDADGDEPLVALWPVAPSRIAIAAALEAGEGAVHRLQAAMGFGACEFGAFRFGNLNTPADLQA